MVKILSFDVGIINLAYCIFDTTNQKIEKWEVITLGCKFNAKISCSGIPDLYINLIKELDTRTHLLDVDVVVIEKQPSFNPKMRIIAGCLQTYFYIRGVIDKTQHSIKSVEFFSPKNKLKCYSGPEIVITSGNGREIKSKYSRTKKTGIIICRLKLHEYSETEFINFFEKSSKKDDLADCYLQAITYGLSKKLLKITVSELPAQIKLLTKAEIRKQVKEIKNDDIPETLQYNLEKKFNIVFPKLLDEIKCLIK